MNRFPRHRWARLLRMPVLAVLLLAVLVNPVLAAVGDLHETSHVGSAHAQPVDAHDHVGVERNGDAREEGIDLLHALMHAAHCCGHLTAILASAFVAHPALASDRFPVPVSVAPHSSPRTDPFRPPIAI